MRAIRNFATRARMRWICSSAPMRCPALWVLSGNRLRQHPGMYHVMTIVPEVRKRARRQRGGNTDKRAVISCRASERIRRESLCKCPSPRRKYLVSRVRRDFRFCSPPAEMATILHQQRFQLHINHRSPPVHDRLFLDTASHNISLARGITIVPIPTALVIHLIA